MMMMLFVFAGAVIYYFVTRPEEGDECEGKDDNGNYVIDDKGKCVLKSCKTGYYKSGEECLVNLSGSDCEPTGTKDPQGMYLTNQTGGCELSSCKTGYKVVGDKCIGIYTLQDTPESGRSASSVFTGQDIGVGHGRGRLDSPQGWSPQNNAIGEWYQIDTGKSSSIAGIVTKGRVHVPDVVWSPQYVKTYKVKSSTDGTTWVDVEGGKSYTGNTDSDTPVTVTFAAPVSARYIRIYPQTWTYHPSMRADIISDNN
jgi:hypothetical protein